MAFKNPWGPTSKNQNKWGRNPWSEGGEKHTDFGKLTEQLQDKIFGTEKKEISITQDGAGNYIVNGANGDAEKILTCMVLTPEGAKQAIRLTTMKDEVRLTIDPQTMTATIDGKVEKVHAETQAFDKYDVFIREGEDMGEFKYWKITISTSETYETDRMFGWTLEEKLCIVGSHEVGHIGRINYADTDHTKMIAYGNELRCRFQYSELFPSKSTPREKWLGNYDRSPFFGPEKVNEYYNDAIDGLVKVGKITKEEGATRKETFHSRTTGQ